jgi:tetratricopeptide (TPR) repeat protein
MSRSVKLVAGLGAVLALGTVGALWSADDPAARAQRYLVSGDRYAANRQFSEAIIEYGRAIQVRPEWGEAHYRRAQAYMAVGDLTNAFGAYAKAASMDSGNVDAQIQTGTLLLAAGHYDDAQRYAERAIAVAPGNAAALTLLGNALAGLHHTPRAIEQIEQALALDPTYAPAWTALGAAQLRNGGGKEAAAAFTRAVTVAPGSVDARIALAQYHWAAGAIADAEKTLRAALAIEEDHPVVHRALALLYLTSDRKDEAETHFKALASDPPGQLALADYYLMIDRRERALEVLTPLQDQKNQAHRRGARLRVAAIHHGAGRKTEAHGIVDALIADQPKQEEPKLAKARLLLDDGEPAEAARYAQAVLTSNQESASAHYLLGLAALAVNNLAEAESAFRQVARINPRAAAPQLQLARVHLAQGDAPNAVTASSNAVRLAPEDPTAVIVMSRSLRAAGELGRAEREITSKLEQQPESSRLQLERGWIAVEQRQYATARKAFGAALRAEPALHDAQTGLIATEIASGSIKTARTLVDAWLQESPSVPLRLLLAKVQLAAGDLAAAERTLRDIAVSDSSHLEAFDLLGRLYLSQGRLDQALTEYQGLQTRAPNAAGPLTMIALIHDAQGEPGLAQAAYANALATDPSAGVAANNLAWAYAEQGRLDEALALAKQAQSALRRRPEADDTLGWVHVKRGEWRDAISAFERAIVKNPRNAVYHYHLGFALLNGDDRAKAAIALEQALTLGLTGADAVAARAALDKKH